MGMSASQVRFLSLQHRKHDVGRQLTALSNRKQALSRDMNKVSKNYTEALNQNVLKWSNDSGMTYQNLTYDLMMKPNDYNTEIPYIISTRDGKVVVDSVANLIGKVDGEYVPLEGKTFSSKAGVSGEINYANIAKWITSATNQEGLTGQLYVTTDGLNAGTKNINSYVIPKDALDYGFENTLRYQIFEELGLVSQSTTDEYNELLRKKYGSEGAKKNGNYGNLLQEYIKADPAAGRIMSKVADSVVNGSASVDAMKSVTMAQINGIDLDPQDYKSYFGQVDNNGVWNDDGCLEGNLALAEYAVTEYDKWCADLKELNLSDTTHLEFTATSGRSSSWDIAPVLQMNGTSNQNTINSWSVQTTNVDGATYTTFDPSWFNNGNAGGDGTTPGDKGLLNTTWEEIFDDHDGKDSTIVFNNQGQTTLATVANFVAGLMDKMSDTSKDAVRTITDGTTWTFENVMGAENLVQDTDENGSPTNSYLEVIQAAQKFALAKTLVYYTNLNHRANHESGCDGGGPSPFVSHSFSEYEESYNHTEVADDTQNGWGHAEEDHCGWHSFTRVLGGVFEMLGAMVLAQNPLILLGEAIFTHFNWISNLADDSWSNIDPTSGDGTYALDMNNVMQTYLTFMEMYMAAYDEKGANMLTGEGLGGTYTNVSSAEYRPYVTAFNTVNYSQFGSSSTTAPSGSTRGTLVDGTVYANAFSQALDGSTCYVLENFYKYSSGPLNGVLFSKRDYYENRNSVTGRYSDLIDSGIASIYAVTNSDGWMVVNNSSAAVTASYNAPGGEHAGNHSYTYGIGSTYMYNNVQKIKSTAYNSSTGKVETTDVEFDQMYVKDTSAGPEVHYYRNGTEVTVNRCKYEMVADYTKTKGTPEHLAIKAGATSFGTTIHAYVTQDMRFKQELLNDVDNCRKALEEHNNKMKNFFSNREQKLMDYYDAIFLRIAEQGWVNDEKMSGTSSSQVYLNNKLQNNDYFVTVCQAKVKGGGYNYTNKQAVNIMKIFQVRDEDAENVALATYESEKAAISVKERAVDARMQKLETEQEVINTELESIKKVRNDNIDKYFKIFA